MTSTDAPDFAILRPDGSVGYGWRGAGESILHAIAARIANTSTQGMRELRAYFADDFQDLPANPLADRVFATVGYDHPTGWRGTVAVTMEEDATGECPPLTPDVRALLDDLSAGSTVL